MTDDHTTINLEAEFDLPSKYITENELLEGIMAVNPELGEKLAERVAVIREPEIPADFDPNEMATLIAENNEEHGQPYLPFTETKQFFTHRFSATGTSATKGFSNAKTHQN